LSAKSLVKENIKISINIFIFISKSTL